MEANTRICDKCGKVVKEGNGSFVGGKFLCRDCVDSECVVCDHCGDIIWANDAVSDEHTSLCCECYSNYYHRCENCGSIINDNDANWRGDFPYCNSCFESIHYEIEEYGYKPEPVFYGTGNRYFGVELEVDEGGKDDNNAYALKEIANALHDHIYIKADGSLSDGFEIVSHPMSLNYHENEMDWDSVFRKAIDMDYLSHQTNTCGLHIHVNRDTFGDNQLEQEEKIAKLLYMIEKHWNEIFIFSRRSEYNMNRWAARYGYEKTGDEILKKAKNKSNGRYSAVNLCNYKTIEFRLFRGTLRYNTFIATLQFVNTLCDLAVSMSQEELEKLSWSELVRSVTSTELIRYLKERRLYINEEIYAEVDL